MSLRLSRRLALSAASLLLSTSGLQAAVPNRIGSLSQGSRATLEHTIPTRALRSADLGHAPLDRSLPSVTLHFNQSAAQQTALNQLLLDQQNPSSPRFHHWLTPAQFGAQFGLSSSDLAKVSAWLTGQGLTITAVSPSSNFITVSGTVAQIQSAFGVTIDTLSEDGEKHISNVNDPVLPAALVNVVNGVTGLNDFALKARARTRKVASPKFTSSISGNNFIAPGDFYTIYDLNPLFNSSINGSGITIGVMGQTDISLSDVAAFRTASGLSANAPTVDLLTADPGTSTNDLPEAQLDVEWSGAVAPNATILYVNSASSAGGVINSLINSITSNLAPILTISYGDCESGWGLSNLTLLNQYFEQANAQGQTIVGPGGDSGATDCDYNSTEAADGLAVDFPASSPFVTGAGGSMFNEGSGSYWSASNGTNSGSATGYIPEAVWNETSAADGLGAGGGGVSSFFSKPAWQVGTGVPIDLSRDVPDIALNAAYGHDGYLYCVSGSCVNGYRYTDQSLSVVGGTSVAAPTFAGILALVQQQVGSRLGNVNPQIYGLANSTYYNTVFHDITTGNNSSPCIQGSPNCPSGGDIGYSAAVGYDLATGWGSVDAYNLATKWRLASPAGSGSTVGTTLTSTTISTTAAVCGISSGSLALSVTVANVAGTAVPTGSIQFLVDNVAIGSPVSLTSGAATYTLDTSSLTSGGHNVSAVYLGDSTFQGSKGSLLTDVVSTTQPDFSITPCTASASAASGSSAPGLTFTVNPFNGFTGSVAFTATSDATLQGSYSFSVTPVVISGTGGATTILTLNAYQTTNNSSTGLVKVASSKNSNATPGRRSAYAAGSGVALASLLLLTLPKRRRWASLLVLIISVAAIGAGGCGSGSSTINSGPITPTPTPTPTTTPAVAGTYTVTVVGIASTANGNRVHSTQVTFTVGQ